jgi:small subunit ribosomal protein S1
MDHRPEGCIFESITNQRLISTYEGLAEAMEKGIILEAKAVLCTSSHDLIVDLPCAKGIIPREEGAIGVKEGNTRDIALISRVNKIVCFKVKELALGNDDELIAVLSRKDAQLQCIDKYISKLSPGDIIEARVTHLEQFGSFVDIGCGVPSLIPIDVMSVSRISHPSDRFTAGQLIKAVVTKNENGRIFLSHKELLGT